MEASNGRLYIENYYGGERRMLVVDRHMNQLESIDACRVLAVEGDTVVTCTGTKVEEWRVAGDEHYQGVMSIELDCDAINGGALAGDRIVLLNERVDDVNEDLWLSHITVLDRQSGTALASWGVETEATIAIAVHDDVIYVGLEEGEIAKYSFEGTRIGTITLADGHGSPNGIFFQRDRMYVSCPEDDDILVMSAEEPHALIQTCNLVFTSHRLVAMCFFDNKLLVTDTGRNRVFAFSGV